MAETLEEAKRHVTSILRKYTEKAIPGRGMFVTVLFKREYDPLATAIRHISVDRNSIKYVVNEDFVRANIYNIENPAIKDLLIHETSHTYEFEQLIRRAREAGKRTPEGARGHQSKDFRNFYKKHAHGMGMIGSGPQPGMYNYFLYTGGKDAYGFVPTDFSKGGTIDKCMTCGYLGIYKSRDTAPVHVCTRCGSENMLSIKNVPHREVLDYMVADEKYGPTEMQEWMKRKYGKHIERFQKARKRKKPIRKQMKAKRKLVTPNILKNIRRFI